MSKKRRYTTKNKTPRSQANAPKPRVWDQLDTLKENSRNLMKQAGEIRPFLKDESLRAHLENPQETARLVYSVANDSKKFIEQFNEIADTHKDKKGVAKSDEETMESLNISYQYFELTENFKSTVLPNVASICEHYIDAANKREAIKNETIPQTTTVEEAHD